MLITTILTDWLAAHSFSWERLCDLLAYHAEAPMLFSSGLFFFLFFGFLSIYLLVRRHTLVRILYVTRFIFIIRVVAYGFSCCCSRLLLIS